MNSIPMTDPNGAGILMLTWIPSRNTPFMLALIYQHRQDPSWDMIYVIPILD